jgi:hypothetical protein
MHEEIAYHVERHDAGQSALESTRWGGKSSLTIITVAAANG